MTEEASELLEQVFAAMSANGSDPGALVARLVSAHPTARVAGVIDALRNAEDSIRTMFAVPPGQPSEADVAREAASILTEMAESAQGAGPGLNDLRLVQLGG